MAAPDVDARALAARVVAAMLEHDHTSRGMGVEVDTVDAGHARIAMTVRDSMLNGHGTCHGGVLFALADSAFAFACNSRNRKTVAGACQIDYLRPAHAGDRLLADAREVSLGGRQGVYDVVVRNQHGETVALFRGRSVRLEGEVLPAASTAPP